MLLYFDRHAYCNVFIRWGKAVIMKIELMIIKIVTVLIFRFDVLYPILYAVFLSLLLHLIAVIIWWEGLTGHVY